MLKRIVAAAGALACVFAVQNASAIWEYVHAPFTGTYAVYGGLLGETRAPAPGDARIAFKLTGKAAKEMFDAIGPDVKNSCPTLSSALAPSPRVRQRDMLLCRYRPADGYACRFGFDLSTGLSIGGAVGGAICSD